MSQETPKRISLSSDYAEQVLTMFTLMRMNKTFEIDEGHNVEKFRDAVREIRKLEIDLKRGFQLEVNPEFTEITKSTIKP